MRTSAQEVTLFILSQPLNACGTFFIEFFSWPSALVWEMIQRDKDLVVCVHVHVWLGEGKNKKSISRWLKGCIALCYWQKQPLSFSGCVSHRIAAGKKLVEREAVG